MEKGKVVNIDHQEKEWGKGSTIGGGDDDYNDAWGNQDWGKGNYNND